MSFTYDFLWLLLFLAALLLIIYQLGRYPDEPRFRPEIPAVPAEDLAMEKYVEENKSRLKLRHLHFGINASFR